MLAAMSGLIPFKVRPGYPGKHLLIEIGGDHRADGFPDLGNILQEALAATGQPHPEIDAAHIGLSMDRFISYWTYAEGSYEIDDDIWGLCVTAQTNHAKIIADIEQALLRHGRFVKEPVDFVDHA
jgi:hypothetical protein